LYLGQRDYVLLIFLIGSFYCLAQHCEKIKGYSYLAVAGLLLGAAACIKPYIGLLCCLLLVVIVAQAVRARTGWAKNAVVFTMFCCVVPAVMAAYLFICGGLQAFLDILFNYLLPFYSNFVFQPFIRGTLSSLTGMPFLEIPAILVIACAACLIGRQYRMRRILLAVGMIYGFFHFYFQVRNAYQLYPFVFFMFLCIASWAGFIRSRIPLIYKYIMVAIILHVSILALYRTSSNLVAPPASHIKEYLGSVNLYNDLKDNVGPEQTVQVMDIVTGGIHALYKLRIKQPTRFIYDAHFFHDINEPYIQNLRSEFIQDLRKKPPVFLALSPISWPVKGYERLEAFPELAEWLAANYQLEIERNTYRLYRRIKF